ncbi:MAG: alpha/beta hydrolase family protein, partial [Terriglobia bacterium]
MKTLLSLIFSLCVLCVLGGSTLQAQPLAGTKPLTQPGDLAAQMVAGIDKYLMRELAASAEKRKQFWKPDFSSPTAYTKSVQPNRERLRKMLGVVDRRVPPHLEYVSEYGSTWLVAETEKYQIIAVRWAILPGVDAEGLLLQPKQKLRACVVAVPDASQTPELIAGLAKAEPPVVAYAQALAAEGCQVLIPTLINRRDDLSGNSRLGRKTNLPHREFVYRMAYEMGRHIIGFEIQKILAAVDWMAGRSDRLPVGVIGYGEGGLLALYSGALDERISTVASVGAFGPHEELWREPIDRNVWGQLREFGDAELLAMIAPRAAIIDCVKYPVWSGPRTVAGLNQAAPGSLSKPSLKDIASEAKRLKEMVSPIKGGPHDRSRFIAGVEFGTSISQGPSDDAIISFLNILDGENRPQNSSVSTEELQDKRIAFFPADRQKRQFDQLVTYTQRLWRLSDDVRRDFWKKADPSSPQKWEASCEWYRNYFWEEVIGKLPAASMPPNPRTRPIYDT